MGTNTELVVKKLPFPGMAEQDRVERLKRDIDAHHGHLRCPGRAAREARILAHDWPQAVSHAVGWEFDLLVE
jgi:hypothetical protein